MKTAAKLQDQIDICNQRRAQISPGLVTQKPISGYTQQHSMQDSPGFTRDSQSPAISPQNATGLPELILSPCSIRGSSYSLKVIKSIPDQNAEFEGIVGIEAQQCDSLLLSEYFINLKIHVSFSEPIKWSPLREKFTALGGTSSF
ncbi:hypothetical protein IFR05_008456 [Cadophora sp. M221]|nr:hypothetical protein IFR05_008456 [Cadophora sp. M221]